MKERTIQLEHRGQIVVRTFDEVKFELRIEFEGQPTAMLVTSKDKAVDLLEALIYILDVQ